MTEPVRNLPALCVEQGCNHDHPPKWWRTIDGFSIRHGLKVWDYDLNRAVVDLENRVWDEAQPASERHYRWNGWFEMTTLDGKSSSTMNGERMWVRHPRTGELA